MAKIMLVEDDKSLREIYSIRLVAEGYEVVSAGDGEEALATAVQQRPDLIISDVMMPKISGFDMLDILRSTPETKDIRVIMMTALSSDDQRQRGENLGADMYLVKSQVGIEDVINAVHEVLGDKPESTEGEGGGQDANADTTNSAANAEAQPQSPQIPQVMQPIEAENPATSLSPAPTQPVEAAQLAEPTMPEANPANAAVQQPAEPNAQPAPAAPSSTGDAMEELLNSPDAQQTSAWPGNAAK